MKYLALALTHLPTILSAVVGVEQVLGSGKGATKKQLVLDCIAASAKAGEVSDDKTVAIISALVDVTVGTLNSSGVFAQQTK